MAAIRRRTRARELALQFLYMVDMRNAKPEKGMLEDFFTWQHIEDHEIREFAGKLIFGYTDHAREIRDKIFILIKNWTEERLNAVDRNILRMAGYELSFENDVPFKVTINEAIDLGKKYSTKESGRFVNGILDEYARQYVSGKKE